MTAFKGFFLGSSCPLAVQNSSLVSIGGDNGEDEYAYFWNALLSDLPIDTEMFGGVELCK